MNTMKSPQDWPTAPGAKYVWVRQETILVPVTYTYRTVAATPEDAGANFDCDKGVELLSTDIDREKIVGEAQTSPTTRLPIYTEDNERSFRWYDETGDPSNPHDTIDSAQREMVAYCKHVLGEGKGDEGQD